MSTRTTQLGRAYIASEEGLVPAPYFDKGGVLTWGIGHTKQAGDPDPSEFPLGMPSNVDAVVRSAIDVFERDVEAHEDVVKAKFGAGLAPHELDGLTSWHYNTGGAYTSKAVKYWQQGDKDRAVQIIKSWNKITRNGAKQISDVLVERREEEADIILRAEYPEVPGVPIWRTDGHGHVVWSAPIGWTEVVDFVDYEKPSAPRRVGSGIVAAIAAAIASLAAGVAALWEKIEGLL